MQLAAVNYSILAESDIEMAVLGMKRGIEVSLLGMRLEYLKGWRKESNHEKEPEERSWELVVILV